MILFGIMHRLRVIKKLDTINIEAARIITGATKLCSIQKLLSVLGWDTLDKINIS